MKNKIYKVKYFYLEQGTCEISGLSNEDAQEKLADLIEENGLNSIESNRKIAFSKSGTWDGKISNVKGKE